MISKTCAICEKEMLENQELVKIKNTEPPAVLHALCHYRATTGLLAKTVARLEMHQETGNHTVAVLVGILKDTLEYAEMGANWAFANSIELDRKKIDLALARIAQGKQIVGKFTREDVKDNPDAKPHICTGPGCRH